MTPYPDSLWLLFAGAVAGVVAITRLLPVPLWLLLGVVVGGLVAWFVLLPLATARARRARSDAAAARSDADALADHLFDPRVRLPVLRLVDLETGLVDRVSPALADLVGATAPAIVGRPYADFVHADDVDETARVVAWLLGHPGQFLTEFRNRWPHLVSGCPVSIEWHQLSADGRLWLALDVTAALEAERALGNATARADAAEADLDAIRPLLDTRLRAPA